MEFLSFLEAVGILIEDFILYVLAQLKKGILMPDSFKGFCTYVF